MRMSNCKKYSVYEALLCQALSFIPHVTFLPVKSQSLISR